MKPIKLNLFKKFATIVGVIAVLTACNDNNDEPDMFDNSISFMIVDSFTQANLVDTAGNRYQPDTIKIFTLNNEESTLIKKYHLDYGWYFFHNFYPAEMGWELFEETIGSIDTTFYLYLNQSDMDTFQIKLDRINHETFVEVYFNNNMAYPGPDSSSTGLYDFAYMFKK